MLEANARHLDQFFHRSLAQASQPAKSGQQGLAPFGPNAWRPTLPCLTPMDSMVAAVMNRWENAWVDGLLAQPTPITVVPSTETIA